MDDDLQKSVIFYSWQSDSHDSTNRSLIGTALENVAKRIRNDDSIRVDPVIDRDTEGVAGAVDIATTIFFKVTLADAFVGDVSLVTHYIRERDGESRAAPNANVVTELGYAVAHLTWERVVLVFNEASGDFHQLPFDINRRKLITYKSHKGDADRATARKQLERKLEEQLREILSASRDTADDVTAALEASAKQRIPLLKRALAELEKQLTRHEPASDADRAEVTDALGRSTPTVERISRFCVAAADVRDEEALVVLYDWALEQLACRYAFDDDSPSSTLDYYRFLTHEIITTIIAAPLHAEQWTTVENLLNRGAVLTQPRRDRHRQDQILDFRQANAFAKTLHGQNYRGVLLNERHTDGPLRAIMPILAFSAADYLLFLRTRFAESHDVWIPWSALHMGGPPRFLLKSRSAAVATSVARVVGAHDLDDFRMRLHERTAAVRRFFDGVRAWDPLAYFERQRIGSLP